MFPENPLALSLPTWLVPSTKQLPRAGEQRGSHNTASRSSLEVGASFIRLEEDVQCIFKEFAKRFGQERCSRAKGVKLI